MGGSISRWHKIVGIILLFGGIILLIAINLFAGTPKQGDLLSNPEPTPPELRTEGTVQPTKVPDWVPSPGQEVDEKKLPSNTIVIHNFSYHPSVLTVKPGAHVKIMNLDAASHTITSSSQFFDTGVLHQYEEGNVTFASAGTYSYGCRRHPAMQGTVVVTP